MYIKTSVLIIVFLLLLFLAYLRSVYTEKTYVKSTIDNREYLIRRVNKTEEFLTESANTLAIINGRIEKLISHLKDNYMNDPSKNYFIKKLDENYNPYILSEAEVDKRYTTYTIDKEDIHICLRTRDDNENLYDINTLMYVLLHELGHLCNYSKEGYPIQGHGPEFRYIFKFLLKESIKIGIYKYVNYSQNPQPYCGIVINSSIL